MNAREAAELKAQIEAYRKKLEDAKLEAAELEGRMNAVEQDLLETAGVKTLKEVDGKLSELEKSIEEAERVLEDKADAMEEKIAALPEGLKEE